MAIIGTHQTPHPIWEQPEVVLNVLTPYFGENFLKVRATCHSLRDTYRPVFEDYVNSPFVERYGTLTESEKTIYLDTLIERIVRTLSLTKQLKATRDPWLVVEDEKPPRLVNYKDHFFGKITSTIELLKAKYRFYRREGHLDYQTLLDHQEKIISELDRKPLDPRHPLQDLRDRYRRLQTVNDERISLADALRANETAYLAFFKSLSLGEKVLFMVLSFFHSFYQKVSLPQIELSPLAFELVAKKGVALVETTIMYKGREIPVKICAQLYSCNGKLAGVALVNIDQKNKDLPGLPERLGQLEIRREWEVGNNRYFSEDDFETKENISPLRDRRLQVVFNDMLGQDSDNGDRPIARLLTQLAVEIFQRESETKLVITSHQGDGAVFVAGGFSAPSLPVRRRTPYLLPLQIFYSKQHYFQQIRSARNQLPRKLFPISRNMGSFDVELEKISTDEETLFFTTDATKLKRPATVDFRLRTVPITWEEQIEHHGLLPNDNNPILPKFFTKKMDLYEIKRSVPRDPPES